MSDNSVIIERDGHWSLFILMGTLPCFMTYVSIKNIYEDLASKFPLTGNFWLAIGALIICAPLTFYYFSFGTRKKRILEINELGVLISNSRLIKWNDISEIETNDYPGPRMRFYTIKIISKSPQIKVAKIIFSSDTKPDWDTLTTVLSNYTSMYNVSVS
ncbi:MAG TPA: hypothetical protein VFE54_11135 [Mucilaginibacter sp.]|jgi:hypothetical protein|nr:hypothetical protein [Mucilaginibacter sp.]